MADDSPSLSFNSIKVRLKHNLQNFCVPQATTFQFHKGTIKTVGT